LTSLCTTPSLSALSTLSLHDALPISFGVTPGFFSGLLHEAPDRHELVAEARRRASGRESLAEVPGLLGGFAHLAAPTAARPVEGDRKTTRLNSSHVSISYAVFCLKKK